jgi:hypothetical protein
MNRAADNSTQIGSKLGIPIQIIPFRSKTQGPVRYIRAVWVNPYLMFLVFILLIVGMNPPFQVVYYPIPEYWNPGPLASD